MLATLAALLLHGCGGGAGETVRFRPPPPHDTVDAHRRAVAMASYARVAARAGEFAEAYGRYREALRLHQDYAWTVEAAQAAERGGLFGEAHDTWREAARLTIEPDARKAAQQQAERVQGLIPLGTRRVGITVEPSGVRVELRRPDQDVGRPLWGDEVVWLAPGDWIIEDPYAEHEAVLARLRVGVGGPQMIAVRVGAGAGSDPAVAHAPRPMPRPPERGAQRTGPEPQRVVGAPDPSPAEPRRRQPPAPLPTPPAPEGPPSRGVHGWGPWAVAGLGVVGVGLGAWFGNIALQNVEVANGLNPASASYDRNLATYGDAARSNALYANVALAAGGAMLVGGASWWLLRPAPRGEIRVDAAAGSPPAWSLGFYGRALSASWRF